ncbi:DeoR/GlpR family DNA-binding transcription regulator [Fictibacillus terranigra]|uniref:DeoR/GlpR family DNA-binding transcription regulator n=1 Tax=Fictibacillus terranigra TaxID=3058424 RepID=A0ABT8E8W7_9BACL|nr:DeoR/GlpR family DNA-binding transcription regulator [Fictibacillus sp. CENA-BCM004]MDN4074357.1 DeoR/GlpR family DNA-binding transcription regulator [Fictibacillus sp. CENA-BCM004]
MLAAERKLKIIDFVKKNHVASVTQLSEEFRVHEATIRRDLSEIEREGHLRRTHGGVVLAEGISSEPSFNVRAMERVEEKQRIGVKAAEMINEGDHIILDSGTTTLQIAKNIVNKSNITVVTNDVNIAAEFKDSKGIKVIVTGGILFPESFMLNGMFTNEVLKTLHVHKAFIGTPAIHPKHGITHFEEQMVPAKIGMIRAAQEIIVVTDHTKIGGVSLHRVVPANGIDKLVTGEEASEMQIQQFEEIGISVYLA